MNDLEIYENKEKKRFCVYCIENDWCCLNEQFKPTKCLYFRGNLDFSLRIKIRRWLYWKKTLKR